MRAIARSVEPVGNITLILGVVIYIFAVLGIKVFGKSYTPDKFGEDGVPRWNFNDFWHACMMVFRVLCGEWIEPLWDCMRATSAAKATMFFLTVLVVGNFIVSGNKFFLTLYCSRCQSFLCILICIFPIFCGLSLSFLRIKVHAYNCTARVT